jgi:hypothetical protein
MPFITSEQRHIVDSIGPQVVGDRCFLAYREMVRKWRAAPKWTTAHEIYKEVLENRRDKVLSDDKVALELAWQVLFHEVIMPYEMLKRTENGQIDF